MIRKTWSLSRGDLVSATVSANYLDERSFNTIQSEITTGDSYTLVNAGVQYVSSNERWEVGLNVNNLTDEEAQTYGYDIAGFTIQVLAPPRWASANIKFNF
jgi:outer membrane receptor protein involved in Fe transport